MAQEATPILLKYKLQLEKNPRSAVFAPLAELYRKSGMLDEALRILKNGIRHNPNYIAGYLTLSACYFDLGQFPMSYATLRPIVENQRDNIRLQTLFARVCVELGHHEEALDAYKYLLFLNPRDKAIALKVRELEDRLERPVSAPLKPEQVVFQTNNIFSEITEEIDEWQQVNFSGRSPAVIDEKWEMEQTHPQEKVLEFVASLEEAGAVINEPEVQQGSTLLNFKRSTSGDYEDLDVEEHAENSMPLVTHTLVELYSKQGYYKKALEILDKILELNPKDQRSLDKRKEICQLQLLSDQGKTGNGEAELLAALDQRRADEHEVLVQKKIRKLEAFLKRIQVEKSERIEK